MTDGWAPFALANIHTLLVEQAAGPDDPAGPAPIQFCGVFDVTKAIISHKSGTRAAECALS
jgi:hypothetical protein